MSVKNNVISCDSRINMSMAIVCMVNDTKGTVNGTQPDKGYEVGRQ